MSITKHIISRDFDITKHHVWISDVATFPLYNLSGQLVGFQRYNPLGSKKKNDENAKYFTYITTDVKTKSIGCWGLESWQWSDTLFVTEGIFDACRLTKRGCSAIALLSNNPNQQTKEWLWLVRQHRKVVAICDNDAAGMALNDTAHENIVVPVGDLGDMPASYVDGIIASAS